MDIAHASSFNIKSIISRRRFYLVVVIILLGLGMVYLWQLPPRYQSVVELALCPMRTNRAALITPHDCGPHFAKQIRELSQQTTTQQSISQALGLSFVPNYKVHVKQIEWNRLSIVVEADTSENAQAIATTFIPLFIEKTKQSMLEQQRERIQYIQEQIALAEAYIPPEDREVPGHVFSNQAHKPYIAPDNRNLSGLRRSNEEELRRLKAAYDDASRLGEIIQIIRPATFPDESVSFWERL
ncbi:MAG: hypothetical protein AAF702_34995 [Chloroflexota bacterium]